MPLFASVVAEWNPASVTITTKGERSVAAVAFFSLNEYPSTLTVEVVFALVVAFNGSAVLTDQRLSFSHYLASAQKLCAQLARSGTSANITMTFSSQQNRPVF
jgi:hypothetical protein